MPRAPSPESRRSHSLSLSRIATFPWCHAVVLITLVALALSLGTARSSARPAVSQSVGCVDGGGLRWVAKVIWGGVYRAADGTRRVSVDYAGWTTSRAGAVRTDSSVRTYDGAGVRVQVLRRTESFNYKSGAVFRVRNPLNPVSRAGRARVSISVGVDGDGFRNCTVTFVQPATSSAPAPSPTPRSAVCKGTVITTASDVESIVEKAPPGVTFCFSPGIYHVGITPKSGQVFDGGGRAAVLDGQSRLPYAFHSLNTSNVTIRGFVVQHYKSPLQSGAIQSFGTTAWTIERNQLTRNAAAGVATDTGAKVLNNLIDHNGQQGYTAHGKHILYYGNEIAYNNENFGVDPTWEAGGGKAWDTQYATFRDNYVHDNGGNGLWDDTNNIYITYDHNRVANNWGAGIYHEIGYDATITNNVVLNNGTATSPGGGHRHGWLWGAGIQLRSSGASSSASPILIAGNTVTNNYNGIALLDSPADGCTNKALNEGAYGPCRIQNVLVRDNSITMHEGGTGAVQDGSGTSMFTSRNVLFQGNEYHVGGATRHPEDGRAHGWFAWDDSWPSWTQWRAAGNDRGGKYGP